MAYNSLAIGLADNLLTDLQTRIAQYDLSCTVCATDCGSTTIAVHGKTSRHKRGLQAPLYGRSYGILQSGSHGDVPPGKPLSD